MAYGNAVILLKIEEIKKLKLLGSIEFDASSGMQQIFVKIPRGMTARTILEKFYTG